MPDSSPSTAGRIVVGTDGSPTASHAVDWAATVAAKRAKPLLILAADRGEQSVLDAEAARAQQRYPQITIATGVAAGEPGAVLVDATRDAELVVVGARGQSAPLRVRALGGVADHVVTNAQGQTMVVPEGAADREGPVVVGVDESPEATEAIRAAFGAAMRTGNQLRAIHVLPEHLGASRAWAAAGVSRDALLQPTQEMVDGILAPLAAEHPQVPFTREIVWGHPTKVLIDESERAYIVVVGSRGHGGFTGMLLGSTSRDLLRHSRAPVMVLRRGLKAE